MAKKKLTPTKKINVIAQEQEEFLGGFEMNIDDPLNKQGKQSESLPTTDPKAKSKEKPSPASNIFTGLGIETIRGEIARLKSETKVFSEKRTTINVPFSISVEVFDLLNEVVGSKTYELSSALITLCARENKKEIMELITKRKKGSENLLG